MFHAFLHGRHKKIFSASQSCKLFCILQNNPSVLSLTFSPTTSNRHSFTVSYLINKCGLSPESAFTASKFVKFETPDKPDSFVTVFKSHGFSEPQITSLIRKRPRVFLSDVNNTLLPKIEFFKSRGFSRRVLAKMLGNNPNILHSSSEKHIIPFFDCLGNLLKSDEAVIKAMTSFSRIMTYDLNKYMFPNIEILRNYGVPESNIVKVLHSKPRTFLRSPVVFKENVEKVKEMGLNPTKMTFAVAVLVLNFMSKSMWDRKFYAYKNCGWSEKEIVDAFRKYPTFITVSEERIMKIMDFLVKEMGLQSSLIAKWPRDSCDNTKLGKEDCSQGFVRSRVVVKRFG
ncbi:hypothetical protein DITRI_Ditri15bG0120700 [Diplodiscus trichospermus]